MVLEATTLANVGFHWDIYSAKRRQEVAGAGAGAVAAQRSNRKPMRRWILYRSGSPFLVMISILPYSVGCHASLSL